jgi:hypothetical protein
MRVRKSLSRPRSTITPKTLNEAPKITKKTIKRLKNAVGTAYPPENLVAPDLELEKVNVHLFTLFTLHLSLLKI